jgi:hypothetical protein
MDKNSRAKNAKVNNRYDTARSTWGRTSTASNVPYRTGTVNPPQPVFSSFYVCREKRGPHLGYGTGRGGRLTSLARLCRSANRSTAIAPRAECASGQKTDSDKAAPQRQTPPRRSPRLPRTPCREFSPHIPFPFPLIANYCTVPYPYCLLPLGALAWSLFSLFPRGLLCTVRAPASCVGGVGG